MLESVGSAKKNSGTQHGKGSIAMTEMVPWDEFKAAMKGGAKLRRERNLQGADPEGWTKHTEWHWSRDLCGSRLDYWPSRNRFRWKGKTYSGDVKGFIRKRET